jgi:hypothetical protein
LGHYGRKSITQKRSSKGGGEGIMSDISKDCKQDFEYDLDPEHIFISFFRVMTHLLTHPRLFFEAMPVSGGFRSPFLFLVLCSIVFTIGSSSYLAGRTGLLALIFFANSIAMPFFTAFVLYIVVGMFFERQRYETLFRISAYACITQLAAWIPFFGYLTEPWRFFLIGAGLVKTCGLTWRYSLVSVVISFVVILLFIWSLQPVMVFVKSIITSF